MSEKAVSISEAEAVIMEVIWRHGSATGEEVFEELGTRMRWQEGTVKALLNRLLNKGAVAADKNGRRYRYTPLLSRDTWLGNESQGFIDRLFDGKLAPFVLHFSSQRKLSKKDIDELRRLVEELGNDE